MCFLDGIWLKRCWAGEVKNVSVLVAIEVDQYGYRQVLGIKDGAKEGQRELDCLHALFKRARPERIALRPTRN